MTRENIKLTSKRYVPRTVSKETPETLAFMIPKYFERAVSDYSDVVPLLQKAHQDTDRAH